MKLPIKARWNLLLILFFAGTLLFLITGRTRGAEKNNYPQTDASTDIQVSFKLDPRLLGSTYGGDRWVSPSTYGPIVQAGNVYSVEAQAYPADAQGNVMQIIPDWIPADSDMVTVSPTRGNRVTINIQRAGESSLQVIAGKFSTMLTIKAVYKDNTIQVEIFQ